MVTLVSKAQLIHFIDNIIRLLGSIRLYSGFSILTAIRLVFWIGAAMASVRAGIDAMGD